MLCGISRRLKAELRRRGYIKRFTPAAAARPLLRKPRLYIGASNGQSKQLL